MTRDERTFLQRNQKPLPPPTPITKNVGDTTAYTNTAHRDEIQQLARCPNGARNHALNISALKLGRLPIDRDTLRQDLINACHANGLIHDDGLRSVEKTINSAFTKADADGPRDVPEQHAIESQVTEVGGGELTGDEARDLHLIAVQRRAYEYQINEEARQLYASHLAAQLGRQATPPVTMTDFLAIPDDDAEYRIDELLPIGGRALLAAQYKAGKTSMIDNLIKAFADGKPFLGRYRTEQATIALLDTEIDERQLRRWLRTHHINNTGNVRVKALRGEVSTFNPIDDANRALWASWLRGSDVIVLDCLRPCLDALGLSEDKDAGRFLVAFDTLLKDSGASEAVLVHHMGHAGERSRGDSRLLDWPDVTWRIIKDKDTEDPDDPNVARYFSAYGRDVDVAEGLLDYNHDTRSLLYVAGSRASHKAIELQPQLLKILADRRVEGLTANEIETRLKGVQPRKVIREAVQKAIQDGSIYVEKEGKSHARRHYISPAWGR